MTKTITCCVTDEDSEFLEDNAISPTKLLRKSISILKKKGKNGTA